jgi:uncharacterized protein (TIGR00645 family)
MSDDNSKEESNLKEKKNQEDSIENKQTKDEDNSKLNFLEDLIENTIYNSRWLLAPIFLGLVLVLLIILIKFFQLLIVFIPESIYMSFDEIAMAILNLLDLALLGNLLLIVTFSGYENFVSKINPATDHKDRPSWMGHLDFSGLKIKIVGSIVAISLIELLQDFLHSIDGLDPNIQFWRIILHITFVISGVLFAIMDYIAKKRNNL